MEVYYFEILVSNLSIELDSDVNYHHNYKIGDIIKIHIYSNGLAFISHGFSERIAEFTRNWSSVKSHRLSIFSLKKLGYVLDVTKYIKREEKLISLGI